jgi:hypothetical protein
MKSVFGLANNQEQLNRAIDSLIKNDFPKSDISVLWPDSKASKDQFHWQADANNNVNAKNADFKTKDMHSEDLRNERVDNKKEKKHGSLTTEAHTKAPEGGVAGATAGGIFGGTLGLLAGIGSLAIPGLGPFIAAGPIMAALSGSAIGGGLGLLLGTLIGYGIPEYEAKRYSEGLKSGKILISVHTKNEDQISTAKEILKKCGITEISASDEKVATKH